MNPKLCTECNVYTYNKDHVCTTYTGPPCNTCGEPTVFFTVGAPGYGSGQACKANHTEYFSYGILTEADVR